MIVSDGIPTHPLHILKRLKLQERFLDLWGGVNLQPPRPHTHIPHCFLCASPESEAGCLPVKQRQGDVWRVTSSWGKKRER